MRRAQSAELAIEERSTSLDQHAMVQPEAVLEVALEPRVRRGQAPVAGAVQRHDVRHIQRVQRDRGCQCSTLIAGTGRP